MLTSQQIVVASGTASGTFKNVQGIVRGVYSDGRSANLSLVGEVGHTLLAATSVVNTGTYLHYTNANFTTNVNVGNLTATYSGTSGAATLTLFYEV